MNSEIPDELNSFESLAAIIARLRSPEGCPWDRKQTHLSLRGSLLEESYEVLNAIDGGQAPELCEELGDLLLQVMLHAQIASDNGDFNIGDVIRQLNEKLIHRHPHVFGSEEVNGAAEVSVNWQRLKEAEHEAGHSLLKSVPSQMPALAYSQEIQQRVAAAGFDWAENAGVIEKLAEETAELLEAGDPLSRAQEFGDVIFTLANLARREGVDLEASLRGTNRKFYRRFCHMEEACVRSGKRFEELSFEAQNRLWEKAKAELG